MFETMIRPVALYALETIPMTGTQAQRIAAWERGRLRCIAASTWGWGLSNAQLATLTKMRPITSILKEKRLQWFGHVCRAAWRRRASRNKRWTWNLLRTRDRRGKTKEVLRSRNPKRCPGHFTPRGRSQRLRKIERGIEP
jgi:hypothetical protein